VDEFHLSAFFASLGFLCARLFKKEYAMLDRSEVISARITAEEMELFRSLANARGISVSDQLREAALKYAVRVRAAMLPRTKGENAAA